MRPINIKHAVWPMPAPTGCTGLWNQSDWNHAAELSRPEGYTGGMFDSQAWSEYCAKVERDFIRREYASYGFDAIANHMSATR